VHAPLAAIFLLCSGTLFPWAPAAATDAAPVEVLLFDRSIANPTPEALTSGALDEHFAMPPQGAQVRSRDYWLKLKVSDVRPLEGMPVVGAPAAPDRHQK
jgi:hypothetical protein